MREHLTGQFTPGTSILHRLDARAKFFGFLILIAATVCTDAWPGYALLLAVTAAVVAICGLPLRTALASVARMGWFFLLIFVMNALFFATDDAIWHWWILTLSVPGIVSGMTMVFVPAVSTFYISQKLGGTETVLIGDVIERQFKQGNNPNLGAALSLLLMVLVFVCTGILNRFAGDDGEEAVIV